MVKLLLQKIKSVKIKPFWLGFILGIPFTFLLLCAIGYFFFNGPKKTIPIASPVSSLEPSATPLPIIIKSSEIRWLDIPQKVAKLDVFKSQAEIDKLMADTYSGPEDVSKFYFMKIADLDNGSFLVNAYVPRASYYGVNYIRFIVKGDNIKAQLDEIGYYEDGARSLLSDKIPIEVGLIQDLEIPKKISFDNKEIYNDYPTFEEFNKLSSPQKIADTQYGPLYTTYTRAVAPMPLFDRIIYLKLKDGLVVRYSLSNENRYDNNIQKIEWLDGGANDVSFMTTPFWGGCGGGSDSSVQVIKSSDIDSIQKQVVGNDSDGDNVYKITDSQNGALKAAYRQYVDTRTNNNDIETIVSYADFLSDKNNILMKDSFNDWVFYLNPTYAQLAECGKPVIYLYPEKEQRVNVQVGAKITKSEPIYPINGWTVFAKPNGELIYQDKTYPYLFWEGLGSGIYPEVKNRGFIVAKNEIEKTLIDHLAKLGLNEKEKVDFLEFWLPKMPKTSYTRLTWLMTDEMNQLAPLSVTPKPDTEIRIFLDFEGLNQKVNLISQKLFAPKRNGFTLVEWGGLLIK